MNFRTSLLNEVMPDLTDYMSTKMVDESKASLKAMVDAKGAGFFTIVTESDEDDLYNAWWIYLHLTVEQLPWTRICTNLSRTFVRPMSSGTRT